MAAHSRYRIDSISSCGCRRYGHCSALSQQTEEPEVWRRVLPQVQPKTASARACSATSGRRGTSDAAVRGQGAGVRARGEPLHAARGRSLRRAGPRLHRLPQRRLHRLRHRAQQRLLLRPVGRRPRPAVRGRRLGGTA